MSHIVTFGEILLRLSPPRQLRFVQADQLDACFGGAEANACVSLANFGLQSVFVSALPDNAIGDAAIGSLRKYGVDTTAVIRAGARVGLYFMENGASQRPSKIIYDRAGSSISQTAPGDFDWDAIFRDAGWFHFTGITPALSDNAAALCKEACIAAKKHGCTVSFDPNYRKLLWSKEKAAGVMAALMQYVDVLITNDGQAAELFGTQAVKCEGPERRACAARIAAELSERYEIPSVAMTLRQTVSAKRHNWSALLYQSGKTAFAKVYPIDIVDRIGGGDSFDAGLIYALTKGYTTQDAVNFATAASCLKHTVEGDYNLVSVDEVNNLLYGGSGRVQR